MARGVNQVEVVDLAIPGFVLQRSRLRLDGDAALFFDVHGVEHLLAHLAIGQSSTARNDPVGQRGLTVINVGNDGEITNVVHRLCASQPEKKGASHLDAP